MTENVKKVLQYMLFLSIGGLLLYFTFQNTNPEELSKNIQSVDGFGLFIAIGIGLIAIIIRGIRWVQLLGTLGYNVSSLNAIAAVAFSYLVNLVTPRVGEVARCTAINRTDDIPIDKLFGTVLLERVVDILMFGFVFLITIITQATQLSIFLIQSGASFPSLSPLLVSALIGVTILLLIGLWSTRKMWSQWGFAQKIISFIQGLVEGLKSVQNVENKFLFWAYSVGIWMCYIATIFVGFKIVPGLEALGLSEAFYVSVAAGLGYVVPVPGGIGAYHYLVSKALTVVGYSPELGTAYATIIHSGNSLMFIATGAIGVLILYFTRKK